MRSMEKAEGVEEVLLFQNTYVATFNDSIVIILMILPLYWTFIGGNGKRER